MGNGVTRQPVFGQQVLVCDAVPDRSPGPLGWQDAADPDEPMCIAGDTPGPVGTGADLSCHQSVESQGHALEVPLLEVSIEKVERFFYTVGLAEAQNLLAKRGFGSANVELGRPSEVESRAKLIAGGLMSDFQGLLPLGPAAVLEFLKTQEKARTKSADSLRSKFSDASKAGANQVQAWGGLIKLFAVADFGATVVKGAIGLLPAAKGWVTVIDIASGVAIDGIDAAYEKDKKVQGVVVSSALEAGGKELGDKLNEAVAEGLMTRNERVMVEDAFKTIGGDHAELLRKIEKIEKRLESAAQGSKMARKNAKQLVSKLKKLGALRKKGFKAASKYTVGKTFSLVFLADDIKDAWGKLSTRWESSN